MMDENMNKNVLSRRSFVQRTVKGAIGAALLPTVLGSCSNWKGANDRIVIGHIGVGDRGTGELMSYFLPLREALNIAVCDTFKDRRENVASRINAFYKENNFTSVPCKSYLDMDELLERKDIDAVHIMTPDHWHLPAAIKAARAGKHIMLAKPLGLSYPQNLILERELKANKVKFHYGTQQRSFEHMQLGYNLIREGAIGEIEHADVWAPGPGGTSPSCTEAPVPEGFDFDRWSGPAPLRPYCPERVTNIGSWYTYDYSIGFLAGWGAHPLDILAWISKDKINGSYSCEGNGKYWASGGLYDNIQTWDVSCKYENGFGLHFVSTDVAEKQMLNHRTLKESNGTTFYGTKGWISLSRSSAQSNIPEIDQKLNNFPRSKEGWINSENNTMGRRFIAVVQGKEAELCPLDEAMISDTISHMGDMVIRTGRKLTWNSKAGEVVGDLEANKLYNRAMRAPYLV